MPVLASAKARLKTIVRLGRGLRSQLRRQGALVALAIVLGLSLGEPLICIVHCQLWLPLAFHSYFASQHRHQHIHPTGSALHSAFVAPSDPAAQAGTQPQTCAFQPSQGNGVPFHVPASPVHDLLPFLGLLIAIDQLWAYLTSPPARAPDGARWPMLRPPILSLGR